MRFCIKPNTVLYTQDHCDSSTACESCKIKDRDLQELQGMLTKLHAQLAINHSQWIWMIEAMPTEKTIKDCE